MGQVIGQVILGCPDSSRPVRFYGARPLKRFIQHHFETQLARSLISGEITDGATVRAGMKNDKLTFQTLEK